MILINAVFQRGQCHGDLEGRARGILPGNRLVRQGTIRIFDQFLPFSSANALTKRIGVKGRHGNQRQDIPIMHIHHNDRGRLFILQTICGEFL